MGRHAYDTVAEFWRLQDSGDYSKTVAIFDDDAELHDPVFGSMRGREAIAAFMQKMNEVMRERQITFELLELAGDDETAWARWVAHTQTGDTHGCGLYRVRNGKLTYYRDYMNAAENTNGEAPPTSPRTS